MSSSIDLTSEADAAKQDLVACEKEISGIKSLLRAIGPQGEADDESNTLSVHWIKIEGLLEGAIPRLSLQLSSPVEEATLTSMAADNDASSDVATFRGVETNQATLTVSAFDADISLGSSEPYDLAPICKFNAMETRDEYETEVFVNISGTAPDENQPDGAPSICSVALKFVYKPSQKDRREELYELLNQCSQRKSAAVERLRQTAVAASRQQMMTTANGGDGQVVSRSSSSNNQKAAVRAGFLNSKPKKEPSKLYQLYQKYLGPQSLTRAILPIAQNYILFGGFVIFMHFKGQLLALPAPV
ncbi:hypothetical protein MPSEU_000821200 [Mayamaea pseudoterrestris]|nr:hypothetical protein MPSEU_000821200 [Mayamaea pseudoterrestris]